MTAVATPGSLSHRTTPLAGIANLVRKDSRDWMRSRRAIITATATSGLVTLGTLVAWIATNVHAKTVDTLTLDPSANLLDGGWLKVVPLIIVFATMGLVTAERERGTLAWVMSQPAERASFLLSKALTSFVALSVVVLVVPLAVSAVAATIAYGSAPTVGTIAQIVLMTLPDIALYLALTLALGTFLDSQGGVAGIAIVLTFVTGFVAVISSDLARYLPTTIDQWVMDLAQGQTGPALTPVIWAVTVVGLLVVGCAGLRRSEF